MYYVLSKNGDSYPVDNIFVYNCPEPNESPPSGYFVNHTPEYYHVYIGVESINNVDGKLIVSIDKTRFYTYETLEEANQCIEELEYIISKFKRGIFRNVELREVKS